MTGPIIAPVALPSTSARPTGPVHQRRVLPLAVVPTRRSHTFVYGMAAIDIRGRIADRHILRTLGWAPGTRLTIRETNGSLEIHTNRQGAFRITAQGHLRVPATLRHRCDLQPGDRALLVADPDHHRLVVCPPIALDTLLSGLNLLGGDPV